MIKGKYIGFEKKCIGKNYFNGYYRGAADLCGVKTTATLNSMRYTLISKLTTMGVPMMAICKLWSTHSTTAAHQYFQESLIKKNEKSLQLEFWDKIQREKKGEEEDMALPPMVRVDEDDHPPSWNPVTCRRKGKLPLGQDDHPPSWDPVTCRRKGRPPLGQSLNPISEPFPLLPIPNGNDIRLPTPMHFENAPSIASDYRFNPLGVTPTEYAPSICSTASTLPTSSFGPVRGGPQSNHLPSMPPQFDYSENTNSRSLFY